MFKKIKLHRFTKLIILVLVFSLGASLGYFYFGSTQGIKPAVQQKLSSYQGFVLEIYDKIKANYWDNLSDSQILELFKLALEKVSNTPQSQKLTSREDLAKLIENTSKNLPEGERKKLVLTVSSTVLASLNPAGRSGLFTQKQEEQLKNTLENINPEKDLYKDLGLAKGASPEAVEKAYQKQTEQLKKDTSAEGREKLKQITYAKDVLGKTEQKQRYDEKGVEPAVFTKLVTPAILYLQFKKFTPTSLDEFKKALEDYKDFSSLQVLIFDLRGNVGGAIDATAYFLGFFLGKGQYAFDFYKKGEYIPFKTQLDKLPVINQFKQVVILVDNQTQSSAEMMAATLKKYKVGVVLGVPTKGWGTVEKVFPLDNQIDKGQKYSMFLVHSITLRDDNQPIEGRGVEPNINIKDANWQDQLFSYFRNPQLINVVKQVISSPD